MLIEQKRKEVNGKSICLEVLSSHLWALVMAIGIIEGKLTRPDGNACLPPLLCRVAMQFKAPSSNHHCPRRDDSTNS